MGWDRMGIARNDNNNTAHSPRLDVEQVMYRLIWQMIDSFKKNCNIFSLYGSNLLNIHMHACTHTTIHTNLCTSQYVHTNLVQRNGQYFPHILEELVQHCLLLQIGSFLQTKEWDYHGPWSSLLNCP